MSTNPIRLSGNEAMDERLLNALSSLNRIGSVVNRLGLDADKDEAAALQLIVDSSIQVLPQTSALIFTYDSPTERFSPQSRASAGDLAAGVPGEQPRPNGMGWRSITQRRLVLSYEEQDLTIDPVKVRAGARAVACFPMVVADEPLGVIYLYIGEDRQFSSLELLMMENFVNQAAMAVYQIRRMAEVKRDLTRKEEELARLRRAGLIISSRLRLKETLEAILEMALEVTSAQYGNFRLLDSAQETLLTQAVAGADLGHPYTQALSVHSSSVSAWVARNRQPVLIHDLTAQPWSSIYFPLDANLQMQSELAVPLISASGRMLGVLNLESPLKHAFSEDDRMLLQSFATQAVIAIQEVSLLDAMQEIPQLLLTQPKADVFQRLTGLACDLLNAPISLIWQQEEDSWRLLGSFPAQDLDVLHPVMPGSGASSFGATLFVDKSVVPQALLVEALEKIDWSHAWLAPLTARPDRGAEGVFCVFTGGPVSGSGGAEWEQKVLGLLSHFAGMASFYELHQNSLRKAQEQHAIAEMFAAVGDLATNLLHQLNNKVGTIPVRVQGIQDKCADLIARDRYLANNLAEIERSASDAMVAVRQNLSHLHPVQMVPVNLAECVRSAMRNANLGTDVQVHFAAMDDLPEVVGGQQNLTLVFTNLLENAAHAMRMQGRVEISGRSAQEWVEVRVKDSGPGIPTEKQERIFELNYSSGSASHAGKLGFGLWWVRALMVRLGGAVWVESDGHSGAEFVLRFPRQKGTV